VELAPPTLRDAIEKRARHEHDRIADKLVTMALAGDKVMMSRLLDTLIGKPQGATDDRGPERFLRLLMGANPETGGGAGGVVGDSAGDLDGGGAVPDAGAGDRAAGVEPAGPPDPPESDPWGGAIGENDDYRGGSD
jgi:hypothetical protein